MEEPVKDCSIFPISHRAREVLLEEAMYHPLRVR